MSDDDGTGTSNETEPPRDPSPTELAAEIEALESQVEFMRSTVSPIAQPNVPTALLVSFARQVEQRCEAIIQAYNQG
jgi:hypothetical protein